LVIFGLAGSEAVIFLLAWHVWIANVVSLGAMVCSAVPSLNFLDREEKYWQRSGPKRQGGTNVKKEHFFL
jgi:uncharacterized BrkB/YihY/UPF0761 family membrane protein